MITRHLLPGHQIRILRIFLIYLSILSISLGLSANSTPGSLRFEHYATEDGLCDDSAFSISHDPWGFAWIGTQVGLARFDGSQFVCYLHQPGNPDSIASNRVIGTLADSRGDVWISFDDGIDQYRRDQDRFVHHRSDKTRRDSLSSDTIVSMAEDSLGRIWVLTDVDLDRFEPETGSFSHHRRDLGELPNNMLTDPDGDLWWQRDSVLFRLDAPSDDFDRLELPITDQPGGYWAYAFDHSGRLWLTDGDLHRLDLATGTLRSFPLPADTAREKLLVSGLAIDRGGVWVNFTDGLRRLDPASAIYTEFFHDARDPWSPISNSITTLYVDDDDLLWLATYAGLDKKTPGRGFEALRHTPHLPSSLSDSATWSGVLEDRRGNLWVGLEKGVDRFTPEGTRRTYTSDSEGPAKLPPGEVSVFLQARSGDIWLGTWAGQVARLDVTNDRVESHAADWDDPTRLAIRYVQSFHEDDRGRLWIGGLPGFDRFDPAVGRFERVHPVLAGTTSEEAALMIYDMMEGRDNQLWITTYDQGLIRLDLASERGESFQPTEDPASRCLKAINTVHEARNGDVWVGGQHGLCRLRPDTRAVTNYFHLMPTPAVTNIIEDRSGFLWIGTRQGLVRFDPRSETARTYDTDDGLAAAGIPIGALHLAASGRVSVVARGGVTRFFPNEIRDDDGLPEVTLTDFRLSRKTVTTRRRDPLSPLELTLPFTEALSVDHHHRVIGFDFSAPYHSDPDRHRLAYRLDNFDEDWNLTEHGRGTAEYSNLRPGEYVFRVRAGDEVHDEWSREKSIRVTVLPAPWRSKPAYALYVSIVVGLVTGAARLQRRKLKREREINHQLREADQLKDQFLAEMADFADAMATGDLRREVIPTSEQDLFGKAFGNMTTNLRRMIGDVQLSSGAVGGAAEEIAASTQQLTAGAETQSEAADETLTTMVEIASQIESVAQSSRQLASNVEDTSSSIQEMGTSIDQIAKNSSHLLTSVRPDVDHHRADGGFGAGHRSEGPSGARSLRRGDGKRLGRRRAAVDADHLHWLGLSGHRQDRRPDRGHRRSDQPAGPQRRHRGGSRRRLWSRLRGRGRGSQAPGRTIGEVDPRDRRGGRNRPRTHRRGGRADPTDPQSDRRLGVPHIGSGT